MNEEWLADDHMILGGQAFLLVVVDDQTVNQEWLPS